MTKTELFSLSTLKRRIFGNKEFVHKLCPTIGRMKSRSHEDPLISSSTARTYNCMPMDENKTDLKHPTFLLKLTCLLLLPHASSKIFAFYCLYSSTSDDFPPPKVTSYASASLWLKTKMLSWITMLVLRWMRRIDWRFAFFPICLLLPGPLIYKKLASRWSYGDTKGFSWLSSGSDQNGGS